ncbi:MAG: hypothetical protein ACE5FD_05845 [Anaerolineae bacterium]
MAEIGIMIEGQEDLIWERLFRLADWRSAGFPGGSPQQLVDQLNAFADARVMRFMLQHNDLDDVVSLELLAAEVMPHI